MFRKLILILLTAVLISSCSPYVEVGSSTSPDIYSPAKTTELFCSKKYNSTDKLATYFVPNTVSATSIDNGLKVDLQMKNLGTYFGQYMAHDSYVSYSGNALVGIEFDFESVASADVNLQYGIGVMNHDDSENIAFVVEDATDNSVNIYYTYNLGPQILLHSFVATELEGMKFLLSYNESLKTVGLKTNGQNIVIPKRFYTGGDYYFALLGITSAGNFTQTNTLVNVNVASSSWVNERFGAKDICSYFKSNTDELYGPDVFVSPSGQTVGVHSDDSNIHISKKNTVFFENSTGGSLNKGIVLNKGIIFDGISNDDVHLEVKPLAGQNDLQAYGFHLLIGSHNYFCMFNSDGSFSIDQIADTFQTDIITGAPGTFDFLNPTVSLGIILKSDQEVILYERQGNLSTLLTSFQFPQVTPVYGSIGVGLTYNNTTNLEIEVVTDRAGLADVSSINVGNNIPISESSRVTNIFSANSMFFHVVLNGQDVHGSFYDTNLKYIDPTNLYQIQGFAFASKYNDLSAGHYNPLLFSTSNDAYEYGATILFNADNIANRGGVVFDAIDSDNYKLLTIAYNAAFNTVSWQIEQVTGGVATLTAQSGSFAATRHNFEIKLKKNASENFLKVYIDGTFISDIANIYPNGKERKVGYYLEGPSVVLSAFYIR